jgi:hypothetical protein
MCFSIEEIVFLTRPSKCNRHAIHFNSLIRGVSAGALSRPEHEGVNGAD